MAYQIGANCSTCHYCFCECPVNAIRFVGNEYAIDEEQCISCGKCAEVCPTGIIFDASVAKPVPTLHETKHYDADLVVLGAGGSGLVAAVRYAQLTGKKVIVVEKAKKPGGSTTLGHAFVTRYTHLHRELGMPDERELAIEEIASDAQEGYPKELLRRAMYALDDMFDWLYTFDDDAADFFEIKDRRGLPRMGPFPNMPGLTGPKARFLNKKSTDDSMGPGWAGSFVVHKMLEQLDSLGILLLTETEVKDIVLSDHKTFDGILAHDPGGNVAIHAKACLIATGGFSRNKKLMDEICPSFYDGYPVHSFAAASNTGDAITLAKNIGAKLDFSTVKIPMFSPTHHPYFITLVWISGDPHMLMVNKNGERYTDESAPSFVRGKLEDQPEHIGYAIFDAKGAELMGNALVESRKNESYAENMKLWKEHLEYECTLDQAAAKADTIEELAEKIHMDPATLRKTIDTYNEGCASGKDAFGKPDIFLTPVKEGPFYALFQGRFNEGAVGGIVNDEHLRPVQEDGSPYEGIYLAGDCCCGVLKKDDHASKFGEMPWAMASGYFVAEEIADYTK